MTTSHVLHSASRVLVDALALGTSAEVSRARWQAQELAKLAASDGGAQDRFGLSVAVSGGVGNIDPMRAVAPLAGIKGFEVRVRETG